MGLPPKPQGPPMPQIHMQPQAFNVDFNQLYNAHKPAGSAALLGELEHETKSTALSLVFVDFLPINPMLAGDVALQLEPLVLEMGKVKKLDLVLRSTGGVAEFPWRIVSVLRAFCEEFEVIVPRSAMSGATHIAISADNLVMTPLSALGSVDPTRNHLLLPRDPQGNPIPASVQDLRHCLEFIKKHVKEEEMGSIVPSLFTQVHPLAIGAIEQSYELSRLITSKVLATRNKKLEPKHVKEISDQLAGKYFSHGYPISRAEVETDLKLPMTKAEPGDSLFKAIESLNSLYTGVFEKAQPVPGPVPLSFRVTGFIETAKSRRVLCQVFGPDQRPLAGSWLSDKNS
jgi:Serine dehydrogenase proteinase